jgi:non-specific serine/threonine protein kinase
MSHEPPEQFASFGALLRFLRVQARMSQRELSIAVGYSEAHLSRLEQGGRRPDLDAVRAHFLPALGLAPASPWAQRLLALAQSSRSGAEGGAQPATPRHTPAEAAPVASQPPVTLPPGPARRATNLPHPVSSFIGRAREQSALRHELATSRLLTLTGPGGAGKTRLAVEVARSLLPAYPDGVWLVPLAQLSDPALVAHAALEALGAPAAQDQSALTRLAEHLAGRRLLLVIDNCEHLVATCAELALHLLRACPELRVLATSREPFQIAGERAWPVPPLAMPDPARMPRAGDLLLYDAVQLFVERAGAARSGFVAGDAELQIIAAICAAVDGLPLAVELAAAWARALSVAEIAARLTARLQLLVSSDRGAPPRHLSLRATLDWSHALLDADERTLFRRLAVFVGGFTLGAAENVAAGEGLDQGAVLPLLAQLVDHSLVAVEATAGETRYRMLETIREYALLRLDEAMEAPAARARHLAWCLAVTEAAQGLLRGELHETLSPWHDNLRAALGFSLDPGCRGYEAQGLALALQTARFWELCGHLSEGRRWLAAALARNHTPSFARARAQWMAGNLAKAQGDLGEAEACYQASLLWFQEHQDTPRVASLLKNLGNLALERGDYEVARYFYEEALALIGADATPVALGSVHNNLGELATLTGDYARAARLFEQSLAYYGQAGDRWAVADVTGNSGWLLFLRGGDPQRAAALLEQSVATMVELGTTYTLALRLCQLGDLLWAQGLCADAVARYWQSCELLRELHHRGQLATLLESLAWAAQGEGAARLLGAAAGLRRAEGTPPAPRDAGRRQERIAALGETLGADEVARQLALGESFGVAQAIAAAEAALEALR